MKISTALALAFYFCAYSVKNLNFKFEEHYFYVSLMCPLWPIERKLVSKIDSNAYVFIYLIDENSFT
jgi:hypothetical protein